MVGAASRLVEAHVRRTLARARAGDPTAAPTGGRQALSTLVLRALQQASYSPRNLGHAGLGSACYCHFTSPIRRYPDLVCHRALLSTLGGPERAPRAGTLQELGEWTSAQERAAMEVERDADDVARCFALERELLDGDWQRAFVGEVVGLIGAGAFVAFGPPAGVPPGEGGYRFEGMLPVRRLAASMSQRSSEQERDSRDRPPAQGGGARRGSVRGGRPGARPNGAARANGGNLARAGGREWWELNEQGTVLRGERSGTTLRLGDPVTVRVGRVDPRRGRVDLDLAPADG